MRCLNCFRECGFRATEPPRERPLQFFVPAHRRRSLAGHAAGLAAACLTVLLAGAPRDAAAESDQAKGLAVVREAERRNQGWGDSVAEARMILRDRQGNASVRRMELRSLEAGRGTGGGRTLLFFRSPPDVDGTALLTHSYVDRDDDQWLYLPEIKRVKRISGSGKSGSFMGSEFSYEDMRDAQIEKYTFRFDREDACGALRCFVVERRPRDDDSMYVRHLVWIDTQEYRTIRIAFFDRKNFHLKTLEVGEFRRYLDRYWRPHRLVMENHQTGKITELLWENYRFRQNLALLDFEQTSLNWLR